MIKTEIADGRNKTKAHVTPDNALCVQPLSLPGFGEALNARIYRQFLTNSSGSNDMQVSASAAAPQDFSVDSTQDNDVYIKSLSFVIADASAVMNKFGNITALSNGCQLIIKSTEGEIFIHDALKTNFNFARLCQGNPAFGDGTSAFRASNVSGSSEAFFMTLDFGLIFGLPYGLRLRAGTEDKIIMRIQDDTTAVDQFDCIAYGFERLKND